MSRRLVYFVIASNILSSVAAIDSTCIVPLPDDYKPDTNMSKANWVHVNFVKTQTEIACNAPLAPINRQTVSSPHFIHILLAVRTH